MFDYLYNSDIVDVVAYGVDDVDYTPNILGFGTSIGETGYLKMIFSRGALFFSTDGITEGAPVRHNVHPLSADDMRDELIGRKLERIEEDNGQYRVYLYGCNPITCYLEKDDGLAGRDYFSIDALNPDFTLVD